MMKSSEKNNSNQIKCIICDYRFRNFSDLELHIKDKHIHYQGKDCEKCGKTFVTAWRLKKHMRIHAQNFTKSCKYFKGNVVCPFEKLGCTFLHDDDEKDGMTKYKSSDVVKKKVKVQFILLHLNLTDVKIVWTGQNAPIVLLDMCLEDMVKEENSIFNIGQR